MSLDRLKNETIEILIRHCEKRRMSAVAVSC